MRDQPNPGAAQNLGGTIPQEHIPLVLNSIVNEGLLGFTRELVNNQWVWTGKSQDGTETTHELFDLVHNDYLAMDMLRNFCQGQTPPMGYQLNYIPKMKGISEQPMYTLYLLAPDAGGQPSIVNQVTANRMGVAICMALCGVLQADLKMQHRTLFPGHYIAIAN